MKNNYPYAVNCMDLSTGKTYEFKGYEGKWVIDWFWGKYTGILLSIRKELPEPILNINSENDALNVVLDGRTIDELTIDDVQIYPNTEINNLPEQSNNIPGDIIKEDVPKIIETIPEQTSKELPEEKKLNTNDKKKYTKKQLKILENLDKING